jgi:hypothetical protein
MLSEVAVVEADGNAVEGSLQCLRKQSRIAAVRTMLSLGSWR